MRYRGYGEYNEGGYNEGDYGRRMRDSRSRYMEGGYGRRGVPGSGRGRRYRGDDLIEELKADYDIYAEAYEEYEEGGSYNGEEQMVKATKSIMKSITEIVKELSESENPEVMKIVQKSAEKIMKM